MKRWWILLAFVLIAKQGLAVPATETTWWTETPWDNPDRGFNWYPDPMAEQKEPPKQEPPPPPKKKTIYEMTTAEEIRKELDRLRSEAVANPTEQRVLEFLRAQNWMMDKSAKFADVARRVVWGNPEVNYSARSPTVNAARASEDRRRSKRRDDTVKGLSETHAILFFARSDCGFCHDQAPILKAFASATGMAVLTISMDGQPIPFFPDARPDNGISKMATNGAGISTVPAIFLIDRATKQTIPLGTGVVAAEELADRIHVLTKTEPGQEF